MPARMQRLTGESQHSDRIKLSSWFSRNVPSFYVVMFATVHNNIHLGNFLMSLVLAVVDYRILTVLYLSKLKQSFTLVALLMFLCLKYTLVFSI